MRPTALIAALISLASLIGLLSGLPASHAQESDPILAALQAPAEAAAAARASELLRDPNTPVLGNAAGDVVLVKFVDYNCPYCKAIEPKLDALLSEDKGIKLVVKEFPILGPASVVAARAALAAARQGKYAAFHHALMGYRGRLTDEVTFATAKDVGLDLEKLRRDMSSPEIGDQIIANYNLARALKVSVTPGYIVNAHVLSGVSAKTSTAKIDFPAEIAAARAKK